MAGGREACAFACGVDVLIIKGKENNRLSNSNKIKIIHNGNTGVLGEECTEVIFVIVQGGSEIIQSEFLVVVFLNVNKNFQNERTVLIRQNVSGTFAPVVELSCEKLQQQGGEETFDILLIL